jgi:hypothetical protein
MDAGGAGGAVKEKFILWAILSVHPNAYIIDHMDPKPKPNREIYLAALRRMTPEQRLLKTMELSELGKQLLLHGLRKRFPEADQKQIHALFLERLARCHNRNY